MLKVYKKPFLPLIVKWGRRKEAAHFTDPPIFIGGCGRSGTTLLLSILSAHNDIFACPKELGAFNKTQTNEDGNRIPPRIDRLYTSLLINRIPGRARRLCEKSPSNVKYIDDIANYYGGHFRFIHIIRDGRDVVLSKHPTAKDRFWVDPERWVNDVTEGLKYSDHPNVYTVFYEDLVQDFTNTIRGICSFLAIEVSHEILNWQEYATVTRNRAYFQGLKDLSNQSIGKWREAESQQRVEELLAYPGAKELLARLHYPESSVDQH